MSGVSISHCSLQEFFVLRDSGIVVMEEDEIVSKNALRFNVIDYIVLPNSTYS